MNDLLPVAEARDKLRALEREARRLDPDAALRGQWREAATSFTEGLLERVAEAPAYCPGFGDARGALTEPFAEQPAGMEEPRPHP